MRSVRPLIVVGAVLIGVMLTSCTTGTADLTSAGGTESATTSAPADSTPVPDAAVETPAPVAVVYPTQTGASIPADQVEAARATGLHIWVSAYGDGTGVVVVPGEAFPQALIDEIGSGTPANPPAKVDEFDALQADNRIRSNAQTALGIPFIKVYAAPSYNIDGDLTSVGYSAGVMNVPDYVTINRRGEMCSSPAAALAQFDDVIAANPGIQILYFTE